MPDLLTILAQQVITRGANPETAEATYSSRAFLRRQ